MMHIVCLADKSSSEEVEHVGGLDAATKSSQTYRFLKYFQLKTQELLWPSVTNPTSAHWSFSLSASLVSSPTPCSWRRWTSRRSTASTLPTSQLSKACGPTQGSRRPTTAAESTSSPTPLNSTSVCLFLCDLHLDFKSGPRMTVTL